MGTILIGNIKGPQGSQGIQGPQGPVGPVGPTGPGADIYNGLDQTEAGVAGLDSYQGRILDQKKLDVAKVANNLTTAGEGYALDARQGKALNEKKFDAANVVNNLTTTSSGYALDARQGRALNDEISTLMQEVSARIKNVGNFGDTYTNVNLLPSNTIGWLNGTSGKVSNLPSTSAFHMITVFPLSTHGFQLAIRYSGDSIYLRTYADGTWSSWKNLV